MSLADRLVPATDLLVPSPSEERAEVEPLLALLTTLCWGLMASRTRLGGKGESDEALEEYCPPSDVVDGALLAPSLPSSEDADEDEEGSTPLPFLGLFLMGWLPKCVRTFWAVSRGRMLHTHSGVLWPLSSGGKWTTPVRVTRW